MYISSAVVICSPCANGGKRKFCILRNEISTDFFVVPKIGFRRGCGGDYNASLISDDCGKQGKILITFLNIYDKERA